MSSSTANAPSLAFIDQSQLHEFVAPVKTINEGHDVSRFLVSKGYGDLMTFLLQLNRAMFPSLSKNAGTQKNIVHTWDLNSSENLHVSKAVRDCESLIDALNGIVDEAPPDPGPRRFGNASFRKWYEIVGNRISSLLDAYIPSSTLSFPHKTEVIARSEIESYLLGSFGSSQRLDYGSGHELSFLAFLGCIWKLGGFSSSENDGSTLPGNTERAIVLHIINPYLLLIRRLIQTYTLEPAGSHGVWGLDDHSFVPYIFGSAQHGPPISSSDQTPMEGARNGAPDPADVAKITAVNRERSKNMYFGAIGFIHDVKKGPFWEHSPMLYDISGVRAGWGKINKGMIKMYNAEVLSKFPVVQHFRFGSLFSWEQDPNATLPPTSAHTSNQPIRDGPSGSLENASARAGIPSGGTKAPWASAPRTIPSVGAGTAAPWAKPPSIPETGTTAPWAATRSPLPPSSDAGSRMMPPTATPRSSMTSTNGLPIRTPISSTNAPSDASKPPPKETNRAKPP